jgi:hypothetical protein
VHHSHPAPGDQGRVGGKLCQCGPVIRAGCTLCYRASGALGVPRTGRSRVPFGQRRFDPLPIRTLSGGNSGLPGRGLRTSTQATMVGAAPLSRNNLPRAGEALARACHA